ncbi:MAG: diaminobutyrate--2-oxoglutarate transaminase [Methanocorpusculum sp.]|jgi:diaminobutyrate-2-oxoglutarate transaminase|nr:diaminobutyrate--2-oxoglutarate transaminase [Methanocorpusculum sp.]MDD3257628.1 diaminobutyrate--2-oxoglutarate transaminase [Methanocorpusculum sp.]
MGLENTNDVLMKSTVFENFESNVRSYCRKYPVIFAKAKGSLLIDQNGNEFIDFLCGAGSCNYGHNNDYIKDKVIEYLQNDGLIHGLDMYTIPKGEFIECLQNTILIPRGYDYKVLFPGPTGTNAVEAALKIARKVKGRSNILALMGGFHGMSLGALSLTADRFAREGAGVALGNVTHVPHPATMKDFDTIAYIDLILTDDHSGVDKPAAIILESVQGEGGINIVSNEWLKAIRALCDKHDMLLILDEIQSGCGRTGSFFSFERAGIKPDIVVMAKSIGGIGMPCAITLVKPEYDVLAPGEHNGTFRGFQLSFVAGKAALEYLLAENVEAETVRKGKIVNEFLAANLPKIASDITYRGLGLMWGIDFGKYPPAIAQKIRCICYDNNVILELCGREDTVVKLLPPLTIGDAMLNKGLEVVRKAIIQALSTN